MSTASLTGILSRMFHGINLSIVRNFSKISILVVFQYPDDLSLLRIRSRFQSSELKVSNSAKNDAPSKHDLVLIRGRYSVPVFI